MNNLFDLFNFNKDSNIHYAVNVIKQLIDKNIYIFGFDLETKTFDEIKKIILNKIQTDTSIQEQIILEMNKLNQSIDNDDFNKIAEFLENDFTFDFLLKEKIKTLTNNTKYLYAIHQLYLKELPILLKTVNFKKESNGTYNFSALSNIGRLLTKDDDKPIIDYLLTNKEFFNKLNLDISFDQWPDLLKEYSKSNLHDEIAYQVRDYIVHLNNEINKQRSDNLAKNQDKINDLTEIDYNPRLDTERSNPIIIYRIALHNGKYKDVVIIGDQGASHGSMLYKQLPEVIKKYNGYVKEDYLDKHELTQAYLVNDIAFLDLKMLNEFTDNNGNADWHYVANLLKQHPRINKVYALSPNYKSKNIVRVAKI